MLNTLEKLTAAEKDLVMNALPILTVMIAAADGKVDESETGWATKLTEIRGYSHEERLQGYYDVVGKDFDQKVRMMVKALPADQKSAVPELAEQLAGLNTILPQLPPKIAGIFLKSLRTFATHIARASGGFLKIASISKEEKALIDLPMITYVPPVIEEEEIEEDTPSE